MHVGSNGHPAHDHEHTDAPTSLIVKFLIAMVITGVVVVGVLAGLWRLYGAMQERPVVSPFAGPRELPPGPRLQTAPAQDLRVYLDIEQKRLSSYGWVDQPTGRVHIPIEKAMDMVLQRGLASRKEGPRAQ